MSDICPLQKEHIETLSAIQTEMSNLKEDVKDFKSIADSLVTLVGEVKIIAMALERNNTDIKEIKDIMGTKESIISLHNKVDTMEEEIDILKHKPAEDALKEQKKIRWLLIATIIVAVFNMFWDKIKLLF